MPSLILYTRAGCCLCEGLEERLRELGLREPPRLVDVDSDPALQARYGLSVPVLAVAAGTTAAITVLPPVPPRLKGERLRAWLRRHIGD